MPTGSLVQRKLRQLRFELKTIVRAAPRLYLPIARRWGEGDALERDTAFVIEGFPRSGNTFATAAFGLAKTSEWPKVAHHLHAPAQVIAAAKHRIPALVLIREPEGCILSFVIQQPDITIRQALRSYVRFYRPLLPYRDRIVVATFDDVVSDFGAVIRRVNERFRSNFDVFEHTEPNVRRCLEKIEEENRRRWGTGPDLEMKGAFPSSLRAKRKDPLQKEYRSEPLRRLRERAEDLFRTFAETGPERGLDSGQTRDAR